MAPVTTQADLGNNIGRGVVANAITGEHRVERTEMG